MWYSAVCCNEISADGLATLTASLLDLLYFGNKAILFFLPKPPIMPSIIFNHSVWQIAYPLWIQWV